MQKSLAELQAIWVTGYTPTQADYSNLFESYENLKDDNLLTGTEPAAIPVSPALQATGFPLVKKVNIYSAAPVTDAGYLLPACLPGRCLRLDILSNSEISVFPASGEQIGSLGTDEPFLLNGIASLFFFASNNSTWLILVIDLQYELVKLIGSNQNISDVTPANQGTATAIINKINNITGTNVIAGGVILPPAKVGIFISIRNSGANDSKIYPSLGERIEGQTTNDPATISPATSATFLCNVDGVWN